MLDPTIKAFFQERKAARIKAKLKASMSDEEKSAVEQQAKEDFTLATWLPSAAKRAKQLFLVSHPSKFSHPSAKTSAIIADCQRSSDGFLRSGNAEANLDVFGNAAALDVYKFLSLVMENGNTVLDNLEANTETIQQQFTLAEPPFEVLRAGLLAIKESTSATQTSEKVKQVYFPVKDDYHLLSILTPSGLMFKLKERITAIRFSEQAKQARVAKRNEGFDEQGFAELYDLSVIGFGGTKPQNISILNSQNYGQAYLLQSLPPPLQKRGLQPPRKNFFSNSLNPWLYKDSFQTFHKLVIMDYSNANIRQGIENTIQFILSEAIVKMWQIRQLEQGWSEDDIYSQLPHYQKIWLDNVYREERAKNTDWLPKVEKELARWFLIAYPKVLGKKAKIIGAEHLTDIKAIIEKNIDHDKEGLR